MNPHMNTRILELSTLSLLMLLSVHIIIPSCNGSPISSISHASSYSSSPNDVERPYYQTPMFQPNISHKKNWCNLHQQVNNGQIPLRDVLQNTTISVAVFDFITNEDTSINNQDLGVQILDELAERGGFTWRNAYGILERPSGNESFDSVLDWSKNVYDITAEWYVVTPQRLARSVIYPGWWFDASYILVQKQQESVGPSVEFRFFNFATPFKWEVWGLIFLTILVTAILTFIIDYIDGRRLNRKRDKQPSLGMSVFSTSMALLGHHDGYQPKSVPTAIITFSSAMMFVLVLSSYTANLTSFLVVSRQSTTDISDLGDVIGRDQRICVKKGTAMDVYVTSEFPSYKKVVRILDRNEMYQALNDDKCDVLFTTVDIWNAKRYDFETNPDCNLEQIGRTVEVFEASFPMGDSLQFCTSILKDALALHLAEMKTDGRLADIKNKFFLDIQTNECNDDDDEDEEEEVKLGVAAMGGIFLFHAALLAFALIWSIIATVREPRMRREMTFMISSRRLIIDDSSDGSSSDEVRDLNELKKELGSLCKNFTNYMDGLQHIKKAAEDDLSSIQQKIRMIKGGGNGVDNESIDGLSLQSSVRSYKSATSLPMAFSGEETNGIECEPWSDKHRSVPNLPQVRFKFDH